MPNRDASTGTSTRAPRVPEPLGELMTRLDGVTEIVQVRPKIYDGKQKMSRDDQPIWEVRMLFTSRDGDTCEIIKASMAATQEPRDLVGKKCERPAFLNALFWQMGNGRNGWAYSLDEGLVKQWRK